MEIEIPKICPKCGGKIILKQGRKADGSFYKFYGCSNFQKNGCNYIWRPSQKEKIVSKSPILTPEQMVKYLGILRGDIKRLEEKIDKLLEVSVIYPKDLKEPRPSEQLPEEIIEEEL